MTNKLSLLERRRLEASALAPFLRALEELWGSSSAKAWARQVVQKEAERQGRELRGEQAPDLRALAQLWTGFAEGGALEIELQHQEPSSFDLVVHRCAYAAMYRELGLEDWGPILSCARDAPFAQAYCPSVEVTQSCTILKGAPQCQFTYRKAGK